MFLKILFAHLPMYWREFYFYVLFPFFIWERSHYGISVTLLSIVLSASKETDCSFRDKENLSFRLCNLKDVRAKVFPRPDFFQPFAVLR